MSDREAEQEERQDEGRGEEGSGDTGQAPSKAAAAARKSKEESEQAKETMKEVEQNPPGKLEDWPDDKAKYETFGGPEGEHSYEEGPESQLGPSSLRHEEGGDVTIGGDKVDDPGEYKGEPIPGGPTDPNAPGGPESESASADQQEEEEEGEDAQRG